MSAVRGTCVITSPIWLVLDMSRPRVKKRCKDGQRGVRMLQKQERCEENWRRCSVSGDSFNKSLTPALPWRSEKQYLAYLAYIFFHGADVNRNPLPWVVSREAWVGPLVWSAFEFLYSCWSKFIFLLKFRLSWFLLFTVASLAGNCCLISQPWIFEIRYQETFLPWQDFGNV